LHKIAVAIRRGNEPDHRIVMKATVPLTDAGAHGDLASVPAAKGAERPRGHFADR
jgi:hypothetical protein